MATETGLERVVDNARTLEWVQVQYGKQKKGMEHWTAEEQLAKLSSFLSIPPEHFAVGERERFLREVFVDTLEGKSAALKHDVTEMYKNVYEKRGAGWSVNDQRGLVSPFLEAVRRGEFSDTQRKQYLATVFPLTQEGSHTALRDNILWETGKRGTKEEVDELMALTEGVGASEHCVRLRAPGGEIIPLQPDKAVIRWETVIEDWLKKTRDPDPAAQMMYLGQRIAGAYRLEKQDVRNGVGEADQYTTTYHFEALVSGHEHEAHCCGAHANDTHRAMMSALAQAALIAWATEGKKQVLVKARRTTTKNDQPALIAPPERYDKFLGEHFSEGKIVKDPETKLIAGGSLYRGEKRPTVKEIHEAIVRFNKALPRPDKPESELKRVLVSCADDRVGVRIDDKGRIHVSSVPEHVSNTMHVSVGERANKILNNKTEPPAVYRSTIVAGIANISQDNLTFIDEQLIHDIPLIVKQVMSPADRTKNIYVDAVVGAESPNEIEAEKDNPNPLKRFETGTVKIFTNPEVLRIAKIDPSIVAAIGADPKNILDLSYEERKDCITAHEFLVLRGLDTIITREGGLQSALKTETEREFRADQRKFGQPRNLILHLRVIRASKRTVESRRFIIHSGT